MGERQQTFRLEEVTRFSIECDHCHSEAVFNGDADVGPGEDIRCPNCGTLMAGMQPLVQAYRTLFRGLKQSRRTARLVIALRD